MTFQESIAVCFRKYADFTGTASRPEYWWFALFVVLVSIGLSTFSPTANVLWSLGTVLPALAAAARRLHETGRSGWWQLISLVPVVGIIVLIVFLAQKGTIDAMPEVVANG